MKRTFLMMPISGSSIMTSFPAIPPQQNCPPLVRVLLIVEDRKANTRIISSNHNDEHLDDDDGDDADFRKAIQNRPSLLSSPSPYAQIVPACPSVGIHGNRRGQEGYAAMHQRVFRARLYTTLLMIPVPESYIYRLYTKRPSLLTLIQISCHPHQNQLPGARCFGGVLGVPTSW